VKRLLIRGLLFLVAAGLIWYFFIKDEHIRISFDYNEPPAIFLQNLEAWHSMEHEDIIITEATKDAEGNFIKNISINDSTFLYNWKIKGTEDGTSRIKVEITDLDNQFSQKLQTPFVRNDFVKRSIHTVTMIKDAFVNRSRLYRVHNIKDSTRNKEFCAYIPVRSTRTGKATDMLGSIGKVMGYLKGHGIDLTGDPFLEITEWNKENDSIKFDFCFPITRRDSFPPVDGVKFRFGREFEGLKADFNGNYKDSDRAWYYLMDKAEHDNKEIEELPVEIFLNDPHGGGDPLKWKAIIYLPLKQ